MAAGIAGIAGGAGGADDVHDKVVCCTPLDRVVQAAGGDDGDELDEVFFLHDDCQFS